MGRIHVLPEQVANKMARRLGDPQLAGLVAASDLEKKADFGDKKGLEKLLKAVEKAKLKLEGKITFDEEHSLYELVLASGNTSRRINWALAATPDYKRLRTLFQTIAENDRPPFTVSNNGSKVIKQTAGEVLAHVLEDDSFLLCRYIRKDH